MTLSAYDLKGNFGKKCLTNGTGHENVSEKRNALELYHLQNTRAELFKAALREPRVSARFEF